MADGAVAAFREPSAFDRPCDTPSPDLCYLTSREMWTGEKIIFLEKSVIVPFFKDMSLNTFEFAPHDYFFYMTLTCLHCLIVGTGRMRGSMPLVASVGSAVSIYREDSQHMCNQMYVPRRM